MPSEAPRFSSAVRDIVFAKTPKGRTEVVRRSAALNGKQRSILIVIDGQKCLSAIGTLLPEQEVAWILNILLELELIAPQTEPAVSAAAPRSSTVDHASTPRVDSAKLLRIKTMMMSSAEAYLGPMAMDVVRRAEEAGDEKQLLSVLGQWHMAMRDSKYGRDVAAMHLEQIKASFRGEDMIALPSPAM